MLKLSQKNVPLATAPFYLPISDGKDLKKKEKKKKKAIICWLDGDEAARIRLITESDSHFIFGLTVQHL